MRANTSREDIYALDAGSSNPYHHQNKKFK